LKKQRITKHLEIKKLLGKELLSNIDITRGYGIFIENMLAEAEKIK